MALVHLIIRKYDFESNRTYFRGHISDRDGEWTADKLSYDHFNCSIHGNVHLMSLNSNKLHSDLELVYHDPHLRTECSQCGNDRLTQPY